MKKYDVSYEMIVGGGMFHCYPVFPIVKEAKEGWKGTSHISLPERIRTYTVDRIAFDLCDHPESIYMA